MKEGSVDRDRGGGSGGGCQHGLGWRPARHVPNRIDTGDACMAALVDLDRSVLEELAAELPGQIAVLMPSYFHKRCVPFEGCTVGKHNAHQPPTFTLEAEDWLLHELDPVSSELLARGFIEVDFTARAPDDVFAISSDLQRSQHSVFHRRGVAKKKC